MFPTSSQYSASGTYANITFSTIFIHGGPFGKHLFAEWVAVPPPFGAVVNRSLDNRWVQLLSTSCVGIGTVNYSHVGMASGNSEMLGTLMDLWDTEQALSGLLEVSCFRRYKPY
jgi:hypothetical protein